MGNLMGETPMRKFVVVAVAGLVAAGAFVFPTNAGGNKFADTSGAEGCDQSTGSADDVEISWTPAQLWPPNHKYHTVTVTVTDSDPSDGDDVSLTTEVTHDEYADPETHEGEMNGAGNTGDDVANIEDGPNTGDGSASTNHDVRAERSGKGDGRDYIVTYEATADDGDTTCTGTFSVHVPHDRGQGAAHKKVHQP